MDPTYTSFSAAHPVFYDQPGRREFDTTMTFSVVPGGDWTEWAQTTEDHWVHWMPPATALPEQGWKIHVSSTPSEAQAILHLVSAYCGRAGLAFKHVRSEGAYLSTVNKDSERSVAGKFITIYPGTLSALIDALEGLDLEVGGRPGPYILSDLRWQDGPLFVRYGAFKKLFVFVHGRSVAAIRDLRTGDLVPDVRSTSFHVPAWVTVPPVLQRQLDNLAATAPPHLPTITGALHHSNAGGVYRAEEDGRRLILKEARPHTGWTPDGRDARARLIDEERTLRQLPPEVSAPRPLASYDVFGHRFLALEHVDGESLADAVAARSPLVRFGATPREYEDYRNWALQVASSLMGQVRALHQSGVTHGDLHPRNIMVGADEVVSLLDFEMSVQVGGPSAVAVGVAGFVAKDGRDAAERDIYAVRCIELFMFLPLTPLIALEDGKLAQLLKTASDAFDLDGTWSEAIYPVLRTRDPEDLAKSGTHLDDVQLVDPAALAWTLANDADPARTDRLWPGDPRQFSEPPLSLAHGALGVASVLSMARIGLTDDQREWIMTASTDRAQWPLGLMNGAAGAQLASRALGFDDLADQLRDELLAADWRTLDSTLYTGLPGVALALLDEARFDRRLALSAVEIAAVLRERLGATSFRERVDTDGGGLFGGATGTAILALRLFEHFGDSTFLRDAERALAVDVASLAEAPDGSLHVHEGWRLMPYLGYGSAGVGLIIAQFLMHVPEHDAYRRTLEGIIRAASVPFTMQAGLLHGRSGFIHFLASIEHMGFGSALIARALERHRDALSLHTLRDGISMRVSGNGLLRASCDLSSGAAGVLLALIYSSPSGAASLAVNPLRFLHPTGDAPLPSRFASTEGGD